MDKNKMLIDATHPEETRVVALRSGRVEEFDFESAARKLLRGNIYLAKVTRVEPSLQAAFIDYGGNRHGFLAFNEIHPDYYQIPVADREALKQEEAAAEQREEEEADERARSRGPRRRRRGRGERGSPEGYAQRQEGGEDGGQEIATFEDGYQTSGPASLDAEQPVDERPAAPLGHAPTAPDDVLISEPFEPAAPIEAPQPWSEPPEPAPPHGDQSTGSAEAAPPAGPSAALDQPGEPLAARDLVEVVDGGAGYDAVPADDLDDSPDANGNGQADDEQVEQVATEDDALEEVPERPRRRARQYKIQEVIKRRQIMLVQVVKEERGNKGAALTTYISLAGRYTVLMPNTARGGGISRKITQPQDRKRLKAIAEELDVPEGMGLIIRTAGASRTKQEIKRDYEYLLRLWESVRDLTLSSTAPCLVYEEGNIIKRAIRDLYSKDFDQIVVAGTAAHREAQDFMEMLMPGTGNQVAAYRAPEPLFARYGIERQLNALFSPYVTLRSGGYIVINQTEALVSIDVNSGKSTREFSIEETALNTNLEAAEEIARQLKLRDLAGLIVVDFIDMEEKRNNRSVERRLKDALRHDRARIQVGRISHFGLLEMSRQRLRAGVLEGSTSQCPHCQGTGIIRSIESVALAVLRGLEDQLLKQPSSLAAMTTAEVALYILNHKRAYIVEMERRYGVGIRVEASDRMQGANFTVERIAAPVAETKPAARAAVSMEWGFDRDEDTSEAAEDQVPVDEPADQGAPSQEDRRHAHGEASGSDEERRGRRRRRRRGRREGGPERDERPPAETTGEGYAVRAEGEPDRQASAPMGGDVDDVGHAGAYDGYRNGAAEESGSEAEPAEAGPEPGMDDRHPGEGGDGGESRRRGRRRGRRGGRARRREGGEAVDGHEWGIAEFARPGADQSAATDPYAHPVDASPRHGIVETIGAPADVQGHEAAYAGGSSAFSASDEAVRNALRLAGWREEREAAPPAVASAPAPAPILAPTPPSVSPVVPAPIAAPIRAFPAAATIQPFVSTGFMAEAHGSTNGQAAGEAPELAAAHAETPETEAPRGGEGGVSYAPEASVPLPAAPTPIADVTPRPTRRGWWQRRFGGAE